MSKKSSTISVTYKFKGDNSGLKDLVANVERMQQAFRDGVVPAEQLKSSLINFNQIAKSFEAIGSAMTQLNGTVQSLANAYAVQEEAETKLQTVMQQRMKATDDQIQSIKDLCSAQQQLGVIGDEVQLAGAQQLATFLTTTTSLQTLIPAMNNLVAQQKGYNATQGDTVAIANLLGKALQGQTSALRRVGITFTEAEEAALKHGNELERASMLAQIITNNVGDMNAALARTDSGKAKQLSNYLGDVKEQIGGIVSGVAPYMSFVSAIVATTANAGRATAAMRGLYSATLGAHGMFKFITASSIASATGMNSAGVAARFLAGGLRMIAGCTVVGLVLWGITAAVDAFTSSADNGADAARDLADGVDSINASEEAARQTMTDARAQLEKDIAASKEFSGSHTQERKKVEELNERYGETMGYFTSLSGWYGALIKNSKAYCEQMETEARIQSLTHQIAAKKDEKRRLMKNSDGTARYYNTEKNTKSVSKPNRDSKGRMTGGTHVEVIELPSDLELAYEKRGKLNDDIAVLEKQLESETKKAASISLPAQGSPEPPKTTTTTTPTSHGHGDNKTNRNALEEIEARIRANQEAALALAGSEDEATKNKLAKLREATLQLVDERNRLIEVRDSMVTPDKKEYTPPAIEEIKTYDQLDEAIAHYQGELGKAEGYHRKVIAMIIKELEKLREKWDEELNPKPADPTDLDRYVDQLVAGSKSPFASMGSPLEGMDTAQLIEGYQQIQRVLSGMDGDITEQQRESLRAAAAEYARYARSSRKAGTTLRDLWGNAQGVAGGVRSMTDALKNSENAWDSITGVINGVLQIFDGITQVIKTINDLRKISEINAVTQQQEATAINASTDARNTDTAASMSNAAAKSMVVMANKPAIASYMEMAAAAYMAATAEEDNGVALGMAMTTEAVNFVRQIGLMPFAKGGIVSGPTLGLIGEYAGASRNPEVVAPLDKLRGMLGPTGQPVIIGGTVRLRGRDLEIALANETRISGKSGKRTNIKI